MSQTLSHSKSFLTTCSTFAAKLAFYTEESFIILLCTQCVQKKHTIYLSYKKRSFFLIMANRFHVFTYQMKPFPSIIIMANRKSVTEVLIIGDVLIPTSLGLILPITACPRRSDITWKTISHCFNILWKV